MSNLSNAIEQFHVFSKTPVSSTLGLGQAVNRGGHTVSLSDVLGEDIPFFSKDQFTSMADAKEALKNVVRENDIIQVGSQIEKRVGNSWQSITLSDGSILKNKDGESVLVYHKGVRLEAVTSGNNSGASSQGNSKDGKKCYFAGRIRKTEGDLVPFFVNVSDKILGGLPSLGYKPTLESEITSETIQAEGTDYWVNSYAGIITFEAARPESVASGHKADELCIKISCFEYIGKMADETKQNAFEFIKETNTATEKSLELGGQNVSVIVDGPLRLDSLREIKTDKEVIHFGDWNHNPEITIQALSYSIYKGFVKMESDTIFINGPICLDRNTTENLQGQWLYHKNGDLYWGSSKLNNQAGTTYSAGSGIDIQNNTISVKRKGGNSSGLNVDQYGLFLNFDTIDEHFSGIFIGPNSMAIVGPQVTVASNNSSIKVLEDSVLINGPHVRIRGNDIKIGELYETVFINGPLCIFKGMMIDSTVPDYTQYRLYNIGGHLYWNGEEVGANYTAGTGITISNKEISVNTSVIQPKLEYITDGAKLRLGTGSKTSNSITIEGPLYLKNSEGDFNQLMVKNNDVDGTIINPDYVTTQQLQAALATKQNNLNYLTEGGGNITIGADHGSILMNGPITITSMVPDSTSGKLYRSNSDLYWNGQKINGQQGTTYTAGKNIQISGSNVISTKDDLDINGFLVKSSVFNGPLQINDILTEPTDDHDGFLYNLNDKLHWGSFVLNGPVFDFIKAEGTNITIGPNDYKPGSIEIQASQSIMINGPRVEIGGSYIQVGDYYSTVFINGPLRISEGMRIEPTVPTNKVYKLYNNNGTLYWNGSPVASTYSGTSPINVSGQTISLSYDSTTLKVSGTTLYVNTQNIATKSEVQGKQDQLTYLSEDNTNKRLLLGSGANSTVVYGPLVLQNSDSSDYNQISVKANSDPSVIVNDPYVTHTEMNAALLLKQDTLNYISENTTTQTITLGQDTTLNGKLSLVAQSSTSDLALYRSGNDIYWGSSKLNDQGGGTTYVYIEEDNTGISIGPSENMPDRLNLNAQITKLNSQHITLTSDNSIIINGPSGSSIKLTRPSHIEISGELKVDSHSVFIGGPERYFEITRNSMLIYGPGGSEIRMRHGSHIETKGSLELYTSSAFIGGPGNSITFAKGSVSIEGPSNASILMASEGIEINGSNLSLGTTSTRTSIFIGPDKVSLVGYNNNKLSLSNSGVEISAHDSIIFNGPGRSNDLVFNSSGVKVINSALFIGPNGVNIYNDQLKLRLGTIEFKAQTSVIFNGPVYLGNCTPLVPHASLYNHGDELYWNGSKVSNQSGTTYTFYSPLSSGPSNIVTLSLTSDSNLEVVNGYLKVKSASFASAAQLAAIDTRVTTLETNLNGVQVSTTTEENNAPDNVLQGSLFNLHEDSDIITVDSETDLSDIMLQDNATVEVHVKSELTPFNITWNEGWKWSGTPLETTEANTCYIIQVRHDAWDNIVCKVTHQYTLNRTR